MLTAGCTFFAQLDECNLGLFRASAATDESWSEESASTTERVPTDEFSATVAPNPFNNECTVSMHLGEHDGNGMLQLSDETGRIVRMNTVDREGGDDYTFTLQATDLPQGIYFLEYRNDEGLKWRTKLVKM